MALKRVVSSRLNRPSKPEFFVPLLELPFFFIFLKYFRICHGSDYREFPFVLLYFRICHESDK